MGHLKHAVRGPISTVPTKNLTLDKAWALLGGFYVKKILFYWMT